MKGPWLAGGLSHYNKNMPEIRIVNDPHDAPPSLQEGAGGFGDMLYQPAAPPEPEQELTPEQERFLGFRDAGTTGPQLGGFQEPGTEQRPPLSQVQGERHHRPLASLSEPSRAVSEQYGEVCVFEGWPRRHARVGRHCPHGMLED